MAPTPATSTALASTWAAQGDLPALDVAMVEEPCTKAKFGRFGAYEVTKKLGEGEFASVYRARRAEDPEVEYAIKAIDKANVQRHNSILKSKRNIRRVNLEVLAMRRFRHGGICQLYEVMQTPSYVYLVLEMGERDLFSFLDEHPDGCPELYVKQIMRILALGLRHCHNAGIAHRDLKPENVLVCGDPEKWATGGATDGIVALRLRPLRDDHRGRQAHGLHEFLHDVSLFKRGIRESIHRVELGSCEMPPSEPVRQCFKMLLQMEPESRSSIHQLCSAPWFDLLEAKADGSHGMVRLTFDRTPFDGARQGVRAQGPVERRFAYRSIPTMAKPGLETIPSSNNLCSDSDADATSPVNGDHERKSLTLGQVLDPVDDVLRCKTPETPKSPTNS
ncbi:protein kinase [Aureococcus anophagefferens]|nr:protein kinase [Aureococcus anophagefferens]